MVNYKEVVNYNLNQIGIVVVVNNNRHNKIEGHLYFSIEEHQKLKALHVRKNKTY